MPTLNGHGLGRKEPSADPRDHLYGLSRETMPRLPSAVDLRAKLPPVFDQGNTSCCGAEMGAAMMAFLCAGASRATYSALALYYETRKLENDVDQDAGVETRDIFKVLQKTGAIPDAAWPFSPGKIMSAPPANAPHIKIGSYARLVGASDMLSCLAAGFPFGFGIMLSESFDGDAVDKSGIYARPDLKKEAIVGGHDMLCVGYDANFKATPFFKESGLAPELVDDTMLLVRNSWGPSWSKKFRGHVWIPLSYVVNPTTGGDAWTARMDQAMKAGSPVPQVAAKPHPTSAQYSAAQRVAFSSVRAALDKTSYGSWVSDSTLRPISDSAAIAIADAVVGS